MNEKTAQLVNLIRNLPLSKKLSMLCVLAMVTASLALMFLWANQVEYQVLFSNLTPEDGGAVVAKLKERNIAYRVEANGTVISVPAGKVYETRLSLAGEGLPAGGNIGFEIFDRPDFRTTQFVQELNYRRALQGELARTINQFKEVKQSRVFIVIPKTSLFVEDRQPASASIQLDLANGLPSEKLSAIVHLVANAVEGLDPRQVTVVDTKGRIIFKGDAGAESDGLMNNSQLEYKRKIEAEIRENVQSMLERIVGPGKAVVRVTAEVDYNKVTLNEEEFDPTATAVRSSRNIEETHRRQGEKEGQANTITNQRAGIMPAGDSARTSMSKRDVATNFEINRVVKTVVKPAGTIKRLSVAAVIDGDYREKAGQDGSQTKIFVPRSEEDLRNFEEIVKRAMGYNEDREDRISVRSIPFSNNFLQNAPADSKEPANDVLKILLEYKKAMINVLLILLVFLFIVRPFLKSLKKLPGEVAIEKRQIGMEEESKISKLPEMREIGQRDRVLALAQSNPEKTQQLIKGWLGD